MGNSHKSPKTIVEALEIRFPEALAMMIRDYLPRSEIQILGADGKGFAYVQDTCKWQTRDIQLPQMCGTEVLEVSFDQTASTYFAELRSFVYRRTLKASGRDSLWKVSAKPALKGESSTSRRLRARHDPSTAPLIDADWKGGPKNWLPFCIWSDAYPGRIHKDHRGVYFVLGQKLFISVGEEYCIFDLETEQWNTRKLGLASDCLYDLKWVIQDSELWFFIFASQGSHKMLCLNLRTNVWRDCGFGEEDGAPSRMKICGVCVVPSDSALLS